MEYQKNWADFGDQIAIDTERSTDNNTVGVLRSGYASSDIGTLTTLPTRVAKSVQSSTNTGNILLFGGGVKGSPLYFAERGSGK